MSTWNIARIVARIWKLSPLSWNSAYLPRFLTISAYPFGHRPDHPQKALMSSSLFDSKSLSVSFGSLQYWADDFPWLLFARNTEMHLNLWQFVLIESKLGIFWLLGQYIWLPIRLPVHCNLMKKGVYFSRFSYHFCSRCFVARWPYCESLWCSLRNW